MFTDVHQDLNIPIPDPIVLNSHSDLPPAKKTKYDNSISKDGSKVFVLPTGSVSTNKHLVELVESVKPHIRKLVEDSNTVRSKDECNTDSVLFLLFVLDENVDFFYDS